MKKLLRNMGFLAAFIAVLAACGNNDEPENIGFEFLSFEPNLLLHYYIDMGNRSIEYTIFNAYVEGNSLQRLLTMDDGTQLIEIISIVDGSLINLVSLNSLQSWFSPYINMIGIAPNTGLVILPENPEMGMRWVANPHAAGDQIIREITGMDVEVITPAGIFSAVEVTTFFPNDGSFISPPFTRTFFEPGIGIVKDIRHEGITFNDPYTEDIITAMLMKVERDGFVANINVFYPHDTSETGFYGVDVHFTTNNDLLAVFNDALHRAAYHIFGRQLPEAAALRSIFLNQNNFNLVVDITRDLANAIAANAQDEEAERRILTAIVETLGQIYNAVGVTISVEGEAYSGLVEIRLMEFWEVGAIWETLPQYEPEQYNEYDEYMEDELDELDELENTENYSDEP